MIPFHCLLLSRVDGKIRMKPKIKVYHAFTSSLENGEIGTNLQPVTTRSSFEVCCTWYEPEGIAELSAQFLHTETTVPSISNGYNVTLIEFFTR